MEVTGMADDSWHKYVLFVTEGETQDEIAKRTGIDMGTLAGWLDPEPPYDDRVAAYWGDVRLFADAYQLPILKVAVQAGILTRDEYDRQAASALTVEELTAELERRGLRLGTDGGIG